SVIRLRILSNVVLPAPLRPMMPTTSPRFTSNDTSCKAQNSAVRSEGAAGTRRHSRRGNARDNLPRLDIASDRRSFPHGSPRRYRLLNLSTPIATSAIGSNPVRQEALNTTEVRQPRDHHESSHDYCGQHRQHRWLSSSKQRPP